MARRQWRELPRWQRTAALVLAPVEVILTAVAVVDLARRPRHLVRGPKAVWWPTILVQPIGPVVYLGWGRRTDG
ncbi:PLDc N-terminal domain-containing protein [Krasilnikovia sp. M28-CT-15]|uniref:PLDc N-terminal domain-containing protein n=1 Tax=Krasilnikovia sp. M28-CT-15 TaxID=3373540 RepID=UPI00387622A2